MDLAEKNVLIQIQWAASSIEEARRLCRYLVQERLVACAQITPSVESIYLWKEQIETAQECLVCLKTMFHHVEKIRAILVKSTSYEVPEIIWSYIIGGHSPYLQWIESCIAKPEN